jgi:DNA-binding response OmpR family regulator
MTSVLAKPCILVVEDELALGALICRGLRAAGYQVGEASDGNKPFASWRRPVIPQSSPISSCPTGKAWRRSWKSKRWPDTKIIAMSGGGRIDPSTILTLAEKLGADAMLKKPFTLKQLLDVLKTLAPL